MSVAIFLLTICLNGMHRDFIFTCTATNMQVQRHSIIGVTGRYGCVYIASITRVFIANVILFYVSTYITATRWNYGDVYIANMKWSK